MAFAPSQEELEAGRGYEALFVPALFNPWCSHLIDGAGVKAGAQVLDIDCGSGVLTRLARDVAGGSGRVVGFDSAPGMLAAARSIDWLEPTPTARSAIDVREIEEAPAPHPISRAV